MISTKELLEWRESILKTKEFAEQFEKIYGEEISRYYEHLKMVAQIQLSIIERLIEQSRENDKEQGK